MNLDKDFFSDFKFQDAYSEERENEATKKINVFIYKIKERDIDLTLKFEARPDVSDLKDRYPRSFHAFIIERVSPDCVASSLAG